MPNIYDPQQLNPYAYCRNNPLIYTDPSGNLFLIDDAIHWAFDSFMGWTDDSFLEGTMNNFTDSWGWVESQNIWGLEGTANMVLGTTQTLQGLANDNEFDVQIGTERIGRAIYETAEVAAVDASLVAVGQASHLYTFPRDLYNLGNSLVERDGVLESAGNLFMGLAIPRYGFAGGWGYGLQVNRETGESSHTFGSRFTNWVWNECDAGNFQHDDQFKHSVWVNNQLSFSDQPRISGVGGLMYKVLGAPAFSAFGVLQENGIGPQSNF